ncbi:unnamed protein product, partial [Porites evermanni]
GYKILKIHEVWHFREEDRRVGLFADYVNTKSEQQAPNPRDSECPPVVLSSQHRLYHISTVRICTEDVMEVVTTRAEEEVEQNVKTNIFIAIYTTAHAQRVLYYDTDSVIYKWRPGQVEIPLGVFLGDFTDEAEGDPIIKSASGGAKNYGYETRGGKVECKVRGFSLNYRNKL